MIEMLKNARSIKCVALILAMALLFLSGCSNQTSSNPSDETSPATPDKVSTEPKTDPIKLRFSSFDPATSNMSKELEAWAGDLMEATNGALDIEWYPGATLHAAPDSLQVLADGGTDMVVISTAFFSGLLTYTEAMSLPTMGFENGSDTAKAFWAAYEQYPEAFAEEFGELKPVLVYSGNAQKFSTKDKKIDTLEALNGLRIRAAAGVAADMCSLVSAVPTTMPPPNMYEALEKSVIDGYVFDDGGATSYNLFELTDYVLDIPITISPALVLMRQETYDSFSDEVKEVFDQFSGRDTSVELIERIMAADAALAEEAMKDVTVITPSDDVLARFDEMAEKITSDWIAAHTTASVDAKAIVDCAKKAIS